MSAIPNFFAATCCIFLATTMVFAQTDTVPEDIQAQFAPYGTLTYANAADGSRGVSIKIEAAIDEGGLIRTLRTAGTLGSVRFVSIADASNLLDIVPLEGLPLETLHIFQHETITDLSPIAGASLRDFQLATFRDETAILGA